MAKASLSELLPPAPGIEESEPPSSRSAARFRNLIDSFHDGIGIHRGSTFLYVNDALVQMLGYEGKEAVLAKSPSDLLRIHIAPDEHGEALEALQAVTRGQSERREDERALSKGGHRIVAHFFHDSIQFDGAPAVMTTLRDVTEASEIRHQLERSDRLASLGTLAAGVAHEINNPLSYVISNLSYCIEQLEGLRTVDRSPSSSRSDEFDWNGSFSSDASPGDPTACASGATVADILRPMHQALIDARDGTDRVARIVRDLKSMTREDDEMMGPVDLESVLDCAIHMAETEIRYRANLRREYQAVATVRGNETRLVQVFLNLLVNAAQAIEDGASDNNLITVRTRNLGEERVAVQIEDTGRGIPEAILNRVFDPFFTTKAVGVGTGLGLSICHGLVYSMGGRISVESNIGAGSCFTVELLSESERTPKSIRPPTSHAPRERARLLVVDDEPMILRSISRILSKRHDVDLVSNGREGLSLIRQGAHYDLIVCDLMMPELTGMDFHATLLEEVPEIAERVVFLTGGAFTDRARGYLERVGNLTLEKPVKPDVLRAMLDNLLGANSGD